MIVEFSVTNFRSIYNKATLSLEATNLTGKEALLSNSYTPEKHKNLSILTSAVIYGANASGKTNLFKALKFLRSLIVDSTDNKVGDKLPYEPFKLIKKAATEPTEFEIDFIAKDNIRYIYNLKYNEDEVSEETLTSYASIKKTQLYHRKKGDSIKFSSSFKGMKKVLEEQLLNNNLLLSKAASSNYSQMLEVYNYFKDNITVMLNEITSLYSKRKSLEDSYYKYHINNFLKVADVGIDSFEIIQNKDVDYLRMPEDMPESIKKIILEEHSNGTNVIHYSKDEDKSPIAWDIDEESSGTKKLFALAGPIINILNNGEVLVCDEINNSLHPLMSEFIVQLFNNKETNPKNAQLIFTTHDTTLLSKENFRRDQIWFTEKDINNSTTLYSLADFDKKEVRWDVPFDKWYLSGRFSALPSIGMFKLKEHESPKTTS